MSIYKYTNNTAFNISDIQGETGYTGYPGSPGIPGIDGIEGPMGSKGEDNVIKTEIGFSSAHAPYAVVRGLQGTNININNNILTLVGTCILTNPRLITSIKILAKAATNNKICLARFYIKSLHTEDFNYNNIIASKPTTGVDSAYFSGLGAEVDYKVIDLNGACMSNSLLPPVETLVGLYAWIEKPESEAKIELHIAQMTLQ